MGTLYIVATPLGHLADTTLRAIEVLKQVPLIAVEDTRHSKRLLDHYEIQTRMIAYHQHNEKQQIPRLLDHLAQNDLALISDAGTPLIRDPGFLLVRAAQDAGHAIVPIPGPSSVMAALCASGLPTDRFAFEGFLPHKRQTKAALLRSLKQESRTLVFFETPHRIVETLELMRSEFGDEREAVIARELTKQFETIRRGSMGELCEWVSSDDHQQKGEFVLMVEGVSETEQEGAAVDEKTLGLFRALCEELPAKKAAAILASHLGLNKRELYQIALTWKDPS